jgi:3-isopropylmalate/(R)-2-methylmalate dehydratase small subunit
MTILESRATLLPVDNIDTDRIIPARFLTTTNRNGLGRHLFEDWAEGSAALSNTSILVAGHNFGCGSSREHAVWALVDRGIRAVISTGFADIFHANALRNGLVPVIVDEDDHARLVSQIEASFDQRVVLNFETRHLRCGSLEAAFSAASTPTDQATPGGAELDLLLQQVNDIQRYEANRQPRVDTRKEIR